MNIRAIKTADSDAAVNSIKKTITKKFDYGVSLEVPKELIKKREYMMSDEFLKDHHNIRMFSLIDELMEYRDEISKDVAYMNMVLKGKITQSINGLLRLKAHLDANFSLNFDNEPNITSISQIQYKRIKQALLLQSKRVK